MPARRIPLNRRIVRPSVFIGVVALILLLALWLGIRSLFPQRPLRFGPIGGSVPGRARQAKIWSEEVKDAKRTGRRPNAALRPAFDGTPLSDRSPGAPAGSNRQRTGSKFRL